MASNRSAKCTTQTLFQLLVLAALACVAAASGRHTTAATQNSTAAGPKQHGGKLPRQQPPPPPPEKVASKVSKFLADSAQRLKRQAPPPPGPRVNCRKHPGLCQPTSCDVWRPDIKDKCQYVREKDACGADDQYIAYLEWFYCTGSSLHLAVSAGFIVWLLLLFYAMSVVAEVFLSPTVQYISERLQLAPDIAGVTLLAFASGAPDIFTQIAAIDGGKAVELELAIASVMGSGLFICCVSLAGVLFVQRIEIIDRVAFMRDVAAYLVASTVTLVFLWNASFGRLEAAALLLLYLLYLGVCLYTSRGGEPVILQHRHAPLPTSDPRAAKQSGLELQPRRQTGSSSPLALTADGTVRILLNGDVGAGSRRQPQLKPPGGVTRGPVSRRLPESAPPTAGARPAAVGGAQARVAAPRRLDPQQPQQPEPTGDWAAEDNDWSPLDGSSPQASADNAWDAAVSGISINNSGRGCGLHALAARFAAAARGAAAEYLHFGSSWGMNAMVVATAPLVLLMHATMPAVSRGHASQRHCLVLAAAAPAFLLLVVGAPRLGLPLFAILWVASAASLYALMHLAFLRGSVRGASTPKANAVFAALAFVQSAVWLATIANEVVALLGGVGAVVAIEEDLLGATVLAWGETLPDLVAMMAVARAGQGTMAVAACFGGPVLNLLVGIGAPVVGATLKRPELPFRLAPGNVTLFFETALLCLVLLVLVPLSGWGLSRRTAWLLLITYAACQLLFLAAQQRWLF